MHLIKSLYLFTALALASPTSMSTLATDSQLQRGLDACAGNVTCVAEHFAKMSPITDANSTRANKARIFSILAPTGWNPAINYMVTDEQIASLEPEKAEMLAQELNTFVVNHGMEHLKFNFSKEEFKDQVAAFHADRRRGWGEAFEVFGGLGVGVGALFFLWMM